VRRNLFDDDSISFVVLVNDEKRHGLWPAFTDFRRLAGVYGHPGRAKCLDYVERNWTDIRPKSLREKLEHGEAFNA
jgi:uncharacterized protein YbdZ (MbtH family)